MQKRYPSKKYYTWFCVKSSKKYPNHMKMQLLCKNHPYSCVIEKGIHGKIHRREVGCAIIFKRERSYTTALWLLLSPAHPAILASNSRLHLGRQCPPALAAEDLFRRRRPPPAPFEPKTLRTRYYTENTKFYFPSPQNIF